jgi:uncharacterized repeat protein (TIGR03803 family)
MQTDFGSQARYLIKAIVAILGLVLLWSSAAWSQAETVLWNFSNSNGDGIYPLSNSLISDNKGDLFGTTTYGGSTNCTAGYGGCGVVFELSPNGSGGYDETILHDFTSSNGDGANPFGGLIFDQKGNLYGTTFAGGANSTGTVYELSPNSGGGWTETVLYSFGTLSSGDASNPRTGLTIDNNTGNLFGAAAGGRTLVCSGCGTVYELSPSQSGWTETVLHNFRGCRITKYCDGADPNGVTLDRFGNLYGGTYAGGGPDFGTVFEIRHTNTGWVETMVYIFNPGSGVHPVSNVIVDTRGHIYGVCVAGGIPGPGTVWELVYSKVNKKFTAQVLYSFSYNGGGIEVGGIAMDTAGNIYGAAEASGNTCDSSGCGTVYKLTKSGKTWSEKTLHTFTDGADGGFPAPTPLVLDTSGNVYGLAESGGLYNYGVAFKISP